MCIPRFALSVAALLALPLQQGVAAATASNASTIHFKVVAGSLIVVPLRVNGAGPFEFVLDTGTSATVVDAKLAAELKLPVTGKTVASTPGKSLELVTVRANRLDVAETTVNDLDLSVLPGGVLAGYPRVRGILGEDFLSRFDFLLDNRNNLVQLEQAPGTMGELLMGQHVPLSSHGSFQGKPTQCRLMLRVRVPELSGEAMAVQLDSGAVAPVLFRSAYREQLRPLTLGRRPAAGYLVRVLLVGNLILPNVLMATPPQWEAADSDGLLPTSMFQRVYISHSGGFAIFNPVAKAVSRTGSPDPSAAVVAALER